MSTLKQFSVQLFWVQYVKTTQEKKSLKKEENETQWQREYEEVRRKRRESCE
jgi:hypothetical protein